MKNSLKSFDYLSCRELQGVEIYKDLFDQNLNDFFEYIAYRLNDNIDDNCKISII